MTGAFEVDLAALRRRRTVKWSLYGPEVLAAWVAEMDFAVAPAVRAALLAAVDREDFGYCEADTSELTDACADFFASAYGWAVPPTRVFLVADVLTGIAAALDEFVPAGAGVVLPTPAYPPLFDVIGIGGRPMVGVPMIGGTGGATATLDLDAIDAAFRDGARALLLCNPHNPTGRVFSAPELADLAAVVDRHDARVIADEVHAPLVYPGRQHVPYASVSDAAASHAITVTSASKAWNLAGLKCAQVVATNHDDAARWRRLPLFSVPGPAPLGIAASVAAYRDGHEWLAGLVDHLDANRRLLGDLVAAHLPQVAYLAPEGTYLAWLDCQQLGLDDPAAFFLAAAQVAVSDGPPFGAGHEQSIRLNFATSPALLEQLVTQMGEAVARR